MKMAELGKKIDEQALGVLTKDLEKQLANKSSITRYNKLKNTQQILADLFSDDTYASHNTKAGLEKTKNALQKIISEREKKGGVMPQYVAAMKKDLETIEYRLAHLEKLNNETSFEVNQDGEILVDDIFLKQSNDITRTGIDINHAGIKLGGKEVTVIGIDKDKEGDLLCNVDGQDFILSHEGDKISVKPSSILLKGVLELSLLGVYGKEEAGNTTKRVGQEKKITINASVEDQKAFKEQDDNATVKAIEDIDAIQDISGKTINTFVHDQDLIFAAIDTVFLTHDATKLYWKNLDASQKKLFIDDLMRSHTGFSGGKLIDNAQAKKVFFTAVLSYKYNSPVAKTTAEMQDAFVGFNKNIELQKTVTEGFQTMLQKNIESATDDIIKNNLAQFYKKYSSKQVSEFDMFYNKLENDQTGAFNKIKEIFEGVKQEAMFDAFKNAMGSNDHVQAEKINGEGVWENIPGDQQKRFSMQMVFQNPQDTTYPTRDRIQYIPTLNANNILSLENFLATFKDEIATLSKNEPDPAKLWGTIKTLILEKLGDSQVKDVLKKNLFKTFSDKISQNISGGNTNILNEMNKFAIDAKAFHPGYKKAYIDNQSTPTNNVTKKLADNELAILPDDFDINEFDESEVMNMTATISDVKRVYEDEAEHAGEEALRAEYEALGAFNFFKGSTYKTLLKRMNLFFFRNEIKDKIKKEELEKYQTNGVDMNRGNLTAAADRHERMFSDDQWNNQTNEKDRIKRSVAQVNDPKIDELCREYLNSTSGMDDRVFEDRFNAIIASNKTIMRGLGKDMKHTASNMLLKLRAERAERNMMEGLLHALEQYATNSDGNAYETTVKNHVKQYVELTQHALSPNLQKALTAPGAQVEKYRRWMRHEIGMAKMQANTLKVKLDVLKNGKGAFEVNNRDKAKGIITRLGTWVRENPKKAIAIGVTTTLGLGIFNPAVAGFVAAVKGVTLAVSRKVSDYTEEQRGQEKKLVRGLTSETNRLNNLKNVVNNATRWQKIGLGGTNTYRGVRQGQLYANTTQTKQGDFMRDAKNELITIQNLMLDTTKRAELQRAISDAMARLDYYVTSGHNFLGQEDDKDMEETMNGLQKITLAGAESLGMSKQDLRNNASYTQAKARLHDGYTEMTKKFRKQRNILGLKYGIAAAIVSGTLRHFLASDVHHHTTPPHTPGPVTPTPHPIVTPTPNPTTPPDIYSTDFDAKHHDLFKLSKIPGGSIDALSGGMNPEQILEHCSHINVLDPKISDIVIKHMALPNAEGIVELAPKDVPNVLSAVNQMATGHGLPPSQYLQDKVARYLYHFAERDPFMSQVIEKSGDAIKHTVTDGGSGQSGWLDSFLSGGATFGRYLLNIASVTSPMFANTFLENPDVQPRDKNGKKPGDIGYIPLYNNTIVDPNKKSIPGGFNDENALDWIIRKGQNQKTTNTIPSQNNIPPVIKQQNNTISPASTPVDNNSQQIGDDSSAPTDSDADVLADDTALQIQTELEKTQAEEFVNVLTGKMRPLIERYDGYMEIYNDIKTEFETVKNETDISKKLASLHTLKARMGALQNSIQGVKDVANSSYDTFKEKYDALSAPVQEKVKDKLAELKAFHDKTETTIGDLAAFIETLKQAIVDVGSLTNTIVSNTPSPAPVAVAKPTSAKAPVVKKEPTSKTTQNKTGNSVDTNATKGVDKIISLPPKILDRIKSIQIPKSTLGNKEFLQEVGKGYDLYLDIINELESHQIKLRKDLQYFERDVARGVKLRKGVIADLKGRMRYFNERADAFADAFTTFTEKTDTRVDEKDPLWNKRTAIINKHSRIADIDESLSERIKKLESANQKLGVTLKVQSMKANTDNSIPANLADVATVSPDTASVVSSTVSLPTITADTILEEFKKVKGSEGLRITKKDKKELFEVYKKIIEDNADMYNFVSTKKEIAIIGILDKTTWVGKAKS